MPHLSPMNWISAISLFWLVLLIISSTYWWTQPNKFFSSSAKMISPYLSYWKW